MAALWGASAFCSAIVSGSCVPASIRVSCRSPIFPCRHWGAGEQDSPSHSLPCGSSMRDPILELRPTKRSLNPALRPPTCSLSTLLQISELFLPVGGGKYILVFMTSCSLSSGITLICPGSRTKKGRGLWMDFGAVHHSVLVD